MCAPILPTIAHPSSREPLEVSKGPLPWDNCYHPTCYDLFARVPSEWRDYLESPCADDSFSFGIAHDRDIRYRELLRTGLDDDRILRILDGQEDAPDTDDVSETDSQICKTFLAKIPDLISLKKIVPSCPLCVSTTSCRTSRRYLIHRNSTETWIFSKSTSISSPAANPF